MYREILVTLDGSEYAELALPHARAIAKAFSSRIVLISVVERLTVHPEAGSIGPVIDVQLDTKEEMECTKRYLSDIAGQLGKEGVQVEVEVRKGSPVPQICDYIETHPTDLVVMSAHGRSGLKRWVYGSVTDGVLRNAHVPVLLVRDVPQ